MELKKGEKTEKVVPGQNLNISVFSWQKESGQAREAQNCPPWCPGGEGCICLLGVKPRLGGPARCGLYLPLQHQDLAFRKGQ